MVSHSGEPKATKNLVFCFISSGTPRFAQDDRLKKFQPANRLLKNSEFVRLLKKLQMRGTIEIGERGMRRSLLSL